uniref:Uncharacterized protein n=1 Tax=Arundo donax TaxID=35708 RepID=A0A0A8Z4L9_ARUDO
MDHYSPNTCSSETHTSTWPLLWWPSWWQQQQNIQTLCRS